MVGEITAVGPGVADLDGAPLRLGDRVTWSMVWSCGRCYYCRNGLRPKCERLLKFGHEQLAPRLELFGGLGEYCFLPEGTAICRIPEHVPDEVACPSNCATSTVAAVLRHAGEVAGRAVVVYGAGMLGLTACAWASAAGASRVIAVETDPARRALALEFGAAEALDGHAGAGDLAAQVRGLTGGRGAELVLEFTGVPEAVEKGFEMLRFGGHYVLAGATFPARKVELSAEQIVRRIVRVSGVYNYEPGDLRAALGFLADHGARFPFSSLVGRVFPLDRVEEAFAYAERERPPRAGVRPCGSNSDCKED
jgi:alcohol dehydrogenase